MTAAKQACISDDRIRTLLHGQIVPADEHELQEHLAECKGCQARLESLAAERSSWMDAVQFLVEDPWRSSIARKQDKGDGNLAESSSFPGGQIQHVLDSLHPTDDPKMLGRIGSYEVSGVIGSGSMGVVLKAQDRSLDRIVAIKVLSPHLASSGAARQRFEREAKAAAGVLHPNVIAIHGVCSEVAMPFLVMPYMRGSTLQKRIDSDGALPVTDILRIGIQIAEGLAAAHEQGLIHRDIKPANILLEEGVERVTITDFGLARAVDDATVTRTGIIAGTPHYMSPEQARGENVDHRSDLFSLGSVLYALCTGRPPFRAETTYGILRQITDAEPRPIREVNPEIPDWLCVLIERLHRKDLSQRYPSATCVAELLGQCLAHLQNSGTELPFELLRRSGKRMRNGIFVAAIVLTTCLLVAGAALLQQAGPAEEKSHGQLMDFGNTDSEPDEANPVWRSEPEFEWQDDTLESTAELLDRAIQLEQEIQASFLPLEQR